MDSRKHISLLELQRTIKERLDDAFPLTYWVAAEISELKVNYSGHCYLELVEKGGDNQVPRAKCSAVIWRSTYGALSGYFSSATGSELAAGMKVLLRVGVTYHELYGLSLQISDIDPLYTLGEMEQQRLLTIKKLQDEGVYDMNRELEMPSVVQRVAVVSSRNAAGFQDFFNELAASPYRFEVTLFDAFMQGAESEDSIIGALERIADGYECFDVVVVIRGGGSQSDLACFNSYRLCSHLAQFPLPVITGIGHDKDQSVADLVAYVSLKTPTAVAGWLVDGVAELDSYLEAIESNVTELAIGVLDSEKRRLQKDGFMLSQMAVHMTRSLELRLEKLYSEMIRRSENAVGRRQVRLDTLTSALREHANRVITAHTHQVAMYEGLVAGRSPDKILSLGFAVVRSQGKAVKSASLVNSGDILDVELASGTLIVEAKESKMQNVKKR